MKRSYFIILTIVVLIFMNHYGFSQEEFVIDTLYTDFYWKGEVIHTVIKTRKVKRQEYKILHSKALPIQDKIISFNINGNKYYTCPFSLSDGTLIFLKEGSNPSNLEVIRSETKLAYDTLNGSVLYMHPAFLYDFDLDNDKLPEAIVIYQVVESLGFKILIFKWDLEQNKVNKVLETDKKFIIANEYTNDYSLIELKENILIMPYEDKIKEVESKMKIFFDKTSQEFKVNY